jgi:ABC-2 type transport system permease protein
MGYMAPSMAIFFLMFTTTTGGRSILYEREGGTLPRLLVTPTSAASILGGKMLGTWLTGLGQMIILMAGTRWLLGANWGPVPVVAPLLVVLVSAATGFGMIIAALSQTPAQAGAMGTTMVLLFGALSGNMLPRTVLPEWMRNVSYIAPNAWGLEAFMEIQAGGGLSDIGGMLAALAGLTVITFGIAVWAFHRRLLKGEGHG